MKAKKERVAVKMVEDFEREEAQKLVREAERLTRVEEENRPQLEETRVAEIALTFMAIREELVTLHFSQKLRLATCWRAEYQVLHERQMDSNLKLRHSREMSQLENRYRIGKFKKETGFQGEYNERQEEENSLKKEDTEKVASEPFRKGKPESVDKIKLAQASHQETNIAGFEEWDLDTKYRLRDLAQTFERKKLALEELHRMEVIEAEQELRNEWRSWARNRVAEVKWFDAVIEEREYALQNLELQDMPWPQ
ncbi:hypothetical protein DSL72_002971 [Monilinia vaccinii-corymbosi]|uniref:Uncharacterized protein n=1 Tax=Monilinia vaccinii-corymbosi TaxID=61207 RepID=A0A8A3PE94_9HELO|nr:hypothetical protein DSL72_002971 [Monilinia vaccinii-corymbosi]